MQIQETIKKHEFENLLPLVNVVFLLLIFFMVAGAFSKPEFFNISAPYAQQDDSAANTTLTILMNAEGQLAIGDQFIPQSSLVTVVNEALLTENLNKVQIKADSKAQADALVSLLEQLSTTNLDAVHLLTTSTQAP